MVYLCFQFHKDFFKEVIVMSLHFHIRYMYCNKLFIQIMSGKTDIYKLNCTVFL